MLLPQGGGTFFKNFFFPLEILFWLFLGLFFFSPFFPFFPSKKLGLSFVYFSRWETLKNFFPVYIMIFCFKFFIFPRDTEGGEPWQKKKKPLKHPASFFSNNFFWGEERASCFFLFRLGPKLNLPFIKKGKNIIFSIFFQSKF